MKKFASYITLIFALLTLAGCGGNTLSSAGNAGSASTGAASRALTVPAPAISSFSPAWQFAGSAITIYGTNFDTIAANNVVNFPNKQQAVVASATSTALVVIVPAGAGYGAISVATAGGKATSASAFVVKTAVSSTTPTITNAPATGTIGSTVTISGTNFDAVKDNNKVTFNGTPALVAQALVPASAVMATSLVVTVPDATNGNITVTTPGGTAISAHTFSLTPLAGTLPVIQSFTPLRGLSGSSLTITGMNFDPVAANNTVKFFNGVTATVTAASATSLTVTVPAGASSGPITVANAASTAKSAAIFTVTDGIVPVAGLSGGAIQGTPLNLLGTAFTFAGGGIVNSATDGSGANARFNNPNGMTSDGVNLYIADSGNRVIRRIDLATGVVSTLAGSGLPGAKDGTGYGATFSTPVGIATDGTSLYVADSGNNRVRKITPLAGTGALSAMTFANAQVTTLAGTGSISPTAGSTWDSATGTTATIRAPYGITTDGANLFVTDGSNRIRKIVIATTAVTTLAGSGVFSSADGTGTAASFYRPHGIAITPNNLTLYVTDSGSNVIRKIDIATGVVTTLLGPGFVEGTVAKSFQNPNGIVTDGTNLYVADSSNNTILKIVIANLQVTTLAGTGNIGATDSPTGTLASFRLPNGLAMSGANLYISDSGNNLIRQAVIAAPSAVTTIAGGVVNPANINGTGTATKFNFPYGVTTDGINLYVSDSGNQLIRKIVIASGVVTTVAGSGLFGAVDARATAASFNYPFGLATDGTNLFVADTGNNTIRQIVLATGDVTTLAGSGVLGSADGIGIAASFNQPKGITTDGTNVYVTDTGNNKVRQIVIATGVVTTVAGFGGVGATNGNGAAASFDSPTGITISGNQLYVADSGNNLIRQVDIATGAVSTLAGSGAYWYNDVYDTVTTSWQGSLAHFRTPTGITTDGVYLYVTDADNNEIRRIVIATGVVTTLSGSGAFGSLDGTGTAASFSQPVGITTDGKFLYTTEYQNNLIRKIQ